MSRRKIRHTNTWTQIGVSICLLMLPPILAIAVLAPHPQPRDGAAQGAAEPVEESALVALPVTEGSLSSTSRSLQLPVPDPTEFENRFAAAFGGAEETGSQPPPVPDEPSLALQAPAPDGTAASTPSIRFHHRRSWHEENRDISVRHVHRISKPRSSGLGDNSQRPAHRIRPTERRQPVSRTDTGNIMRSTSTARRPLRFSRAA
jgi:hypothetical protein